MTSVVVFFSLVGLLARSFSLEVFSCVLLLLRLSVSAVLVAFVARSRRVWSRGLSRRSLVAVVGSRLAVRLGLTRWCSRLACVLASSGVCSRSLGSAVRVRCRRLRLARFGRRRRLVGRSFGGLVAGLCGGRCGSGWRGGLGGLSGSWLRLRLGRGWWRLWLAVVRLGRGCLCGRRCGRVCRSSSFRSVGCLWLLAVRVVFLVSVVALGSWLALVSGRSVGGGCRASEVAWT